MATTFVQVETDDQIDELAALAGMIFREYYPDIISTEQTEYMASTFLTPEHLASHINDDGYEYYFIQDGGKTIGFVGLRPDGDKLFLSKLYILKEYRGQGHASEAFGFLENICKDRDLDAIWLQVNKNNRKAIDVYKVKGFETVRQQTMPIGDGFEMDDFIMEKAV